MANKNIFLGGVLFDVGARDEERILKLNGGELFLSFLCYVVNKVTLYYPPGMVTTMKQRLFFP